MIANLNDVSWGTRSGTSAKKRTKRKFKEAKGFVPKIKQFVFGPEYVDVEVEMKKDQETNAEVK